MLETKQGYKKVFIRGGKSHEERLIQNNIREVLTLLPQGQQYRFTGSGRLVKKNGGGDRDDNVRGARGPAPYNVEESGSSSPGSPRNGNP